jgi:hypothetical protein
MRLLGLLLGVQAAAALNPREQLKAALAHPRRLYEEAKAWSTKDGEMSIVSSFTLHDDVEVSDVDGEFLVSRRLTDDLLPNWSRAVKKGSVEVTYKPAKTTGVPSEKGRYLETTTFCNDKCGGFTFDGTTYLPLEGDVLVTVNGTTYDVGDYELCTECMEVCFCRPRPSVSLLQSHSSSSPANNFPHPHPPSFFSFAVLLRF